MKTLATILLTMIVYQVSWAQNPFSVGLDFAVRQNRFAFDDPAGRLITTTAQTYIRWSITGHWYASKQWTTEGGVAFIRIENPKINYLFPFGSLPFVLANQQQELQFVVREYYSPVSFQARRGLVFSAGPFAGLGISHSARSSGTSSVRTFEGFDNRNSKEVIRSRSTTAYPNPTAATLETGICVNAFSGYRWHTRTHATWHTGLNRTTLTAVEYTSSLSPAINQATITGNGSGWSGGFMVAYRFGTGSAKRRRVWQE